MKKRNFSKKTNRFFTTLRSRLESLRLGTMMVQVDLGRKG